jgi:hypothetical protein
MRAIDRERAIALATDKLVESGRSRDRYDMTVGETEKEWEIGFAGKEPRTPGDELSIYVDKQSGEVRVMLGE